MIKTYKLFILMSFLLTISIGAESSSMAWLDLAPDARSAGMGGAQVAIVDNGFSPYWNPAGIAHYSGFSGSNSNVYGDMNYLYGSYTGSFGLGHYAVTTMMMTLGGIKNTSYVGGRPVISGSDFALNNSLLMLTYATSLGDYVRLRDKSWVNHFTDNFYIGTNLKLVNMSLYTSSASGFGIDVGIQYVIPKLLYVGVVGYNVVPLNMSWSTGTKETFSTNTQIGVGYYLFDNLLLVADFVGNDVRYGSELSIFDVLALRCGMNKTSYNAGLGLKMDMLSFDIAYTIPLSEYNYMDSSIRISTSYKF
jgi:hypothetical protein